MRRRVSVSYTSNYLRTLIALNICMVSGCVTGRTDIDEIRRALEQTDRINIAQADTYAHIRTKPSGNESPSIAPEEETRQATDTLRDLILRALQENPGIAAARETVRAKSQRWAQATALPDPILTTKYLPEPVRTAEGDNFFNLGVAQKFPVPEKLDRAGRIALAETRMALEQFQSVRIRVVADVKRAYFRLYVLDKSIGITGAHQDLLLGLIDVARSQVASGRGSQGDVLRAQLELSSLQAELVSLRQRRVAVVARLNELANREPTTPVAAPNDFTVRMEEYPRADLIARAKEANPELKRLKHRITRDREAVERAKLAYWPDFTVGAEWMKMDPRNAFVPAVNPATGQRPLAPTLSENGSDNWAMTLKMNLPIWFNKVDAGIREARRNLAASQQAYLQAQNRIVYRVTDALERYKTQQELVLLFGNTIIPQAKQTFHVSQALYASGTAGFLDVVDNWRKWLSFNIQYHRALGEHEISVADLEEAIGLSLQQTRDMR